MSADPNRLMFIISMRGKTTWAEYTEAVDFLSEDTNDESESIKGALLRTFLLQSLEALAHCDVEFTDAGSMIYVTPPALCRLPRVGLPQAVLTGARSLHTVEHIREVASTFGNDIQVTVLRHPGLLRLMPDSILVKATSEQVLGHYCRSLDIRYENTPPAWTLVNWCGALPDLEATLDYRLPDSLNWPRYDFNPGKLAFVRTCSDSLPRLTRYRNPTTSLPLHVFFHETLGAEVSPNWGRYLLLKEIGLAVTVYDERQFKVCIPVRAPLPALIARSLCLCSGRAPSYLKRERLVSGMSCSDWIVYGQVPPQIALVALSKLGQVPLLKDI